MESVVNQAWDVYIQQRAEAPSSLNGTLEDLWHKIAQMEAPTPEDEEARLDICSDLTARLSSLGSSLGGTLAAEPHGYFVMGCFTASSPLEIAITGKLADSKGDAQLLDLEQRGAAERLCLLERVHSLIGDSGAAAQGTVRINRTARVPSVSFEHAGSGIPVRVCVAHPGFSVRAHVVRALVQLEPRLRSLVQLVELWADARGLNNPAAGTFNSWALMNLVIFAAQTFQSQPLLPPLCRVCGGWDSSSSSAGGTAPAGSQSGGGSGAGSAAGPSPPLNSSGGGAGGSGSSGGGSASTSAGGNPGNSSSSNSAGGAVGSGPAAATAAAPGGVALRPARRLPLHLPSAECLELVMREM
ncbi:hypothetical protein Agub_g13106, partial [Astrephomene gubernaculifera]